MNFNKIRALYIAYGKTGVIPILSRLKNGKPNRNEILSAIYIIKELPYDGKDFLQEIDSYSIWKQTILPKIGIYCEKENTKNKSLKRKRKKNFRREKATKTSQAQK